MYSIDIIKSCINLYIKLKKNNIIGKKRINYINSVFNVHINTLYNWIKNYYNKHTNSFNFSAYKTHYKYNNTKITNEIEMFIINSIDSNNNFNIKKIKNNIYAKFNIKFSKSSIYYVLHKHNFTYKKLIVKKTHHPFRVSNFQLEVIFYKNNIFNKTILNKKFFI
jgi:transposase